MAGVTYFGTSINESPTIILEAGAKLENVQGIALAISSGKLAMPTAGANVIGLSLFTNDETAESGDELTVQIKDIGKWIAGEKIVVGDELAVDAQGRAVKAKDGNFIVAVALSAAEEAGTVLTVQIIKAGYKGGAAAAAAGAKKLSELTDVEIGSEADGHVLTYSSDGKWKNKAPEAVKKKFAELDDVEISGSADKDTLEYEVSSSKWKNKAAAPVI